MKEVIINSGSIHDNGFFTFETSWIGELCFDFKSGKLYIPILNIYTENQDVIGYFKVNSGIYIEKSFFLFENASRIEKHFAIHSEDRKSFIEQIKEISNFENRSLPTKHFELRGMGILREYTYDGIIRIDATKCYFVIPSNQNYRFSHQDMNFYNPNENKWLKYFIDSNDPNNTAIK